MRTNLKTLPPVKKAPKAKAPAIVSLDHIFLPTRSFEKSWAFWAGGAGGDVGAMWEGDGNQAGMVRLGGVNIVLSQEDESAAQPELGYPIEHGRPVLFFNTPDLDKLYHDLANRGVPILRGPKDTHWGKRAMTVKAGELVLAFVEDKSLAKKKTRSRKR